MPKEFDMSRAEDGWTEDEMKPDNGPPEPGNVQEEEAYVGHPDLTSNDEFLNPEASDSLENFAGVPDTEKAPAPDNGANPDLSVDSVTDDLPDESTPIPADAGVRVDENQGVIEGGVNQEFNRPVSDRTEPTRITKASMMSRGEEYLRERLGEDVVIEGADGDDEVGRAGQWLVWENQTLRVED